MNELELNRQTLRPSPKVVAVRVAGAVDYLTVRAVENYFADMLKQDQPKHVLLDLTRLTFAATPFLGSLVFWNDEMAKHGGALVLFGLRPDVGSLARLIRLERVVKICANEAEALAALPEK